MSFSRRSGAWALAFSLVAARAQAGPVFLTGHDPDFHAQVQPGAPNFLEVSLNYAMSGQLNDNTHKFLWVESNLAATSGHLRGVNSLGLIGLTLGQDYDVADAAAFATVNLSNYSAIAVASSFGGMLTSDELNALIARSGDIAAFINAGGGLWASAECGAGFFNCDSTNLAAPHGALYGFIPVAVSGVSTAPPYVLTPFGATLGFTPGGVAYINDCCTHNSFGAVGGLNIVDVDSQGHATTLAGIVRVDGGGFTPVPEPGTVTLVGLGLVACLRRARARRARRGER